MQPLVNAHAIILASLAMATTSPKDTGDAIFADAQQRVGADEGIPMLMSQTVGNVGNGT